MIATFRDAGELAAHAIWSLFDDQIFIPMLEYSSKGERFIEELNSGDFDTDLMKGREKLAINPMQADHAMLLYCAMVTVEEKELTGLFIDMREYSNPINTAKLFVPYTLRQSMFSKDFRVHKPKQLTSSGDFDFHAAMQSFFDGVYEHEEGSAIWKEHLDQSM